MSDCNGKEEEERVLCVFAIGAMMHSRAGIFARGLDFQSYCLPRVVDASALRRQCTARYELVREESKGKRSKVQDTGLGAKSCE